MTKAWTKVARERRDEIIGELTRAAGKAGTPAERQAYAAAAQLLGLRPKTKQKRAAGSYGESQLCKRLGLPELRDAAIREILDAIRTHGGVEKLGAVAPSVLGIARRTLYYTIARHPDLCARVETLTAELRAAAILNIPPRADLVAVH